MNHLRSQLSSATNIKTPSTVKAVQDALNSTIQKLKLFPKIPPNGLILFVGNVREAEGRDKRVCIDIEPDIPILQKKYFCSNYFDIGPLKNHDSYGFIIMSGNGYLIAKIEGTQKKILVSKDVQLPKKHKMGGQSAPRFQHTHINKLDAYVKMSGEAATVSFISDNRPNIKGLFIAGNGELKYKLSTSPFLDERLKGILIKTIDIQSESEAGLSEAIDFLKDHLKGLPLIRERDSLRDFLQRVRDNNKVALGLQECLLAIESNVVEKIIVYEEFENTLEDGTLLIESLMDSGIPLELVSKNTGEGVQFVQSLGGIGCILKYDWKSE